VIVHTISSDINSFPLHVVVVLFIEPNLKVANTNPKLRLHSGVGTEYLYLKCRQNLKLRNLKCRKTMNYSYGILVATPKNEPKMQEFIKLRNLKKWVSTVFCYSSLVLSYYTYLFLLKCKEFPCHQLLHTNCSKS
jgi:hypothetical protein